MTCGEEEKASGQLASEAGALGRQLVLELALALFPPWSCELRGRALALLPSKWPHLFP